VDPPGKGSTAQVVWFGLVWFGLVGFSFNASLGPQRRARKRGRLVEAALAHHAVDGAQSPVVACTLADARNHSRRNRYRTMPWP
jgi:hypothetical protein